MIRIHKQAAPQELIDLRNWTIEMKMDPETAFACLRGKDKEKTLESLKREQGYLCAYCMRRLPDIRADAARSIPEAKIEHWFPRKPKNGEDRQQGLDYGNLLAVCCGNVAGRREHRDCSELTCDARRGNEELKVNPTDAQTLQTICYSVKGEIHSKDAEGIPDPEIEKDLTENLNLNCAVDSINLPLERKKALEPVQMGVAEKMEVLSLEDLIQYCREQLNHWENEGENKTPYVGIIIWWLGRYIKQCEERVAWTPKK